MPEMCRFKVFVLFLAIVGVSCKYVPFYRRDYKYIAEYNAFYKLHQVANNWLAAFDTCDAEDAQLFYPSSKEEVSVLSTLATAYKKNVTSVILGFRDDFHLGEFITIHGELMPFPILTDRDENSYKSKNSCIILDTDMNYSESNCNQKHSFICKRVIDTRACPTIDTSYKYFEATERCYKIHNRKRTWWEALATCYNEGAFLLTLDDNEITNINSLFKVNQEYYLGIRGTAPGADFYTIKGSRLNLYDIRWLTTPGIESNGCVTVMPYFNENDNNQINFGYYAKDCDTLLPFICEMKARS